MHVSDARSARIFALAVALTIASLSIGTTIAVSQTRLPGMQTSNEPWLAERLELGDRLRAVGIPALREEGNVLHTHQHLDVVVAGKNIPVPAHIGIDWMKRFISPVHTHDDTGIIHIEAAAIETYTLGQFFDVWGVRFDGKCLGSYCAGGNKLLRVYADGKLVNGDPRALALTSRQIIAVMYGTSDQVARPPRASYDFPKGF